MKKVKISTFLLCVAVIFSSLTGCGSNQTNGAASSSESVTIAYAIWDKNQKPGMEAAAKAFHEKNPNITINIEVTPWEQYWTKLDAGASSGTLPDIFWMHSKNFLKYANNNMLMDITDKVKNSKAVSMDNFPKELVELYTAKGKYFAMPKDYDTIGLWYNKAIFDAKKIPYPDETWDWNKLIEVAQKVNDPANGIYGFLAAPEQQTNNYNYIYQNGGYVLSEDRTKSGYDLPATQEAIQFGVDFSQKYKVSPTCQQFADTNRDQYFESGKAAMGLFGSWMVGEFTDNEYVAQNCDVTVIPAGKKKATIYNGLANVIAANTKHPDAVWKFLEFLGTKEAQAIMGEKGTAIPAYKGTEQAWIDGHKQFNVKVFPQMLPYAVIMPNSETRGSWETTETEMLSKVYAGQLSVKDGCNELAKQINAQLATEK